MVKTSVYLDEDLAEHLRAEADRRGVSQAELIRDAVRSVVGPRRLPSSIGMVSDGSVPSELYEDWMRANWK